MCSLCAPVLMEPDAEESARIALRLAVLNEDGADAPPGAAAMLAWSGTLHPSAFFCDAAPEETPDSSAWTRRR